MLNKFSAVFEDEKIEWDFRRVYGDTVAHRLQYMLSFLFSANAIIILFDWQNTHDVSLLSMHLLFVVTMISIMLKVEQDGITKYYYDCMKVIISLSVITPLYRYHIYQHTNPDLYGEELALFIVSLWAIIRSIFLILPPLWVILSAIIHSGGFVILAVHKKGLVFFIHHIQHIFSFLIFSMVIFFIVWQFNMLLRQAYYVKEIAYRKLDKLRRVENAFVSETTSQVLAHELKMPLATISGYAQILSSEKLFPVQANKHVGKILNSCGTMDSIIKSIRDMSFNDCSITKESLQDLIADASSLWDTSVYDAKARLKISGDDAIVLVDKILLQSVISNLLRNAIEAKKGGQVSLRIDSTTDVAKIHITNDTRIDRDLDSIFTVYEDSNKRNSTGLGLAFCKDVIEKMHGTITCATQDSETCFTICLPLG